MFKDKLLHDQSFAEVRHTVKRLASVNKGLLDLSEPKQMQRVQKLSQNRKAKFNQHQNTEHARELASLK